MEINRNNIKNIMLENGIYANKNLGQNWLIDSSISKRIVDVLEAPKNAKILEIGPGFGSLTHFLEKDDLSLVEIDSGLVRFLNTTYANDNINIIHNDVLKTDISEYEYIISNIPYYITTDIIIYCLTHAKKVKKLVFMVQKEAGLRFLDKNEADDPLSLLIDILGTSKKEFTVHPNSFYPMPHVDSLVFSINVTNHYENIDKIYKFIKAMFLQKRKTIYNNLLRYLGNKEKAEEILHNLNLDMKLRPENLKKEDYLALFEEINK